MTELKDIKSVFVHWSESEYINRVLDPLDEGGGDIEKAVDVYAFDSIIKHAASKVGPGYDKTSLTVEFNNGESFDEVKFYLTPSKNSLLKLIDI